MFEMIFMGVGAALMFGMWLYSRLTRKRLMEKGTTVLARVTGTAESRSGSTYILEFKLNGSIHRLNYPRPRKGEPFKVGSQVVLYFDPYKPAQMFVEGDTSVLNAEKFYFTIGELLLAIILFILVR